jgi:ubiquinone/menaquinone biosynthesis C-methylase UbiE
MTDSSEHAARVARLFDALSATYDAVGVDFFGPIADGLLAAMPPSEGESWLDVGCGRGAVLLPAAEQIGPTGLATGIDISPAMVDLAGLAAGERGLTNVLLSVGDAVSPEVDGPFDTVSSCLVLFFLTDPGAALTSWLPLLRPGGRIGVTTFGRADERWRHVDEVFEPFLPPAMRDARTSGGPFESDEGMEQLVTASGYVDARTVRSEVAVRFADAQQWHDFTWSTGQRQMWLSIPEGQRPDVREEAERRLASYADADGSVTFTQLVRHTLATRPA